MIVRIWHGWTLPENAKDYEDLVLKEVFEPLEVKNIQGYKGYQLLKKPEEKEVAFISMIWFEKLTDVEAFVGKDYEIAHVPDRCSTLLSRYEKKVTHYEVSHQGIF